MYMEQTKKRKPQKNVTLRDMTYEQLHAYCQEHQIKHSEFVEIALHTFLHIHGNPKDICKNVVKEHVLQDKVMEDLMKTLLKSNRLQKKILGMGIFNEEEEPIEEVITPESIDLKGLLLKAQNKETLTAFEAGVLIGNGFCPKCGRQLKKGGFTNSNNHKNVPTIECPEWKQCGFQIRGADGTPLEEIVGSEK